MLTRTIDLAIKLGSKFPDDVETLEAVDGRPIRTISVPCSLHQQECRSFLSDNYAYHIWTEDGQPFYQEAIGVYEQRETQHYLPWDTIYGLRRQVAAEADLPWMWHGLLLPGAVTLLAGSPKVGKTTFIFNLLEAMLSSRDFLGLSTQSTSVLYITEESPAALVHRVSEENYLALRFSTRVSYISSEPGLNWAKMLEYMDQAIAEWSNGPLLVVVDTISFFAEIEDENDASQVRVAIKPLVDRARTENLAVLLVHHARKSGGRAGTGIRGSSAFAGLVDIIMELGVDNWAFTKERPSGTPMALNTYRELRSLGRYWETPTDTMPLKYGDRGYELNLTSKVDASI